MVGGKQKLLTLAPNGGMGRYRDGVATIFEPVNRAAGRFHGGLGVGIQFRTPGPPGRIAAPLCRGLHS